MQIDKKETYTIISSDENSFYEYYKSFISNEKVFENKHLILNISDKINMDKEDFLLFLKIAELKNENNTSFVIVSSKANADDFPEYLNIVPTLQEAKDVLELEAMERELGF